MWDVLDEFCLLRSSGKKRSDARSISRLQEEDVSLNHFWHLFCFSVLQPQVQSLVTSSQVQPVTIQQQVQTVQAQRVLTQAANGTIQTLTPATVQTVAAPQVQQVPVSKSAEWCRDPAEQENAFVGLVPLPGEKWWNCRAGDLARIASAQMFLNLRGISIQPMS